MACVRALSLLWQFFRLWLGEAGQFAGTQPRAAPVLLKHPVRTCAACLPHPWAVAVLPSAEVAVAFPWAGSSRTAPVSESIRPAFILMTYLVKKWPPSGHYHCSVVLPTSASLECGGERKLHLQGIGFDESVGSIEACRQSVRWCAECAIKLVLSFSHKVNFKTLTSA